MIFLIKFIIKKRRKKIVYFFKNNRAVLVANMASGGRGVKCMSQSVLLAGGHIISVTHQSGAAKY